MFKSLRYYGRSLHIAYMFFKHRKNIPAAFESLGASFIKLGQFLSTRPDLIGIELADSLGYLRDKLPSFEFALVRRAIIQEFGQDIESMYSSFEEAPVAAASVSQVHKATTLDGKLVAVKVLRPNIEKQLKQDVEYFYFIAKKIEKFFPKYKRLRLVKVVSVIETSFKFELDLSFEAAAAAEIYEQNKLEYVVIPKVDWLRTGKRVFTMQWIDGTSIYERQKLLDNNIDLTKLATNFAVMFFHQAFSHGFFHADLHQGNVMVDKDGKVILLDFGIMGRLDYSNRIYVAQILHGFLKRDYALIAKLHHKAGFVSKKYMADEFAQSCRAIGEPIMNLSPEQISIAKLLRQLFTVTENFQMQTQPQLLLLQKTMIMVEGIGKSLSPETNLWQLVEGSIEEWARENISTEARLNKLAKGMFSKLIDRIENLV
jgi:ubiquinone biosynthesis protein